jgi:hypothetical protein
MTAWSAGKCSAALLEPILVRIGDFENNPRLAVQNLIIWTGESESKMLFGAG